MILDEQNVKPSYWAVLPATVRYDEKIPASAKLIYAEISALTEKRGFCYASNEYLMQLFGVSERTLQRHLKALEGCGYIQILDGDGGVGRRKIFAGINPLSNPVKNDGVSPTKLSPNPVKNVTHISKRNSKSSDPPKAPKGAGAGAGFVPKEAPDWKPERFAAFWKYYPLHKSKQAAIRAWDKLKPSDELLAVIGRALKSQIREEKAMAKHRGQPFEWKMYASTYLNNARWTDEVEESPTVQPSETPSGRRDMTWL